MSPSINQTSDHRAAVNRANAQHSTGPRTEAGKQRSKLNALRHGLTGHTIVVPAEDQAAYQRHSQSFLDEYQPQSCLSSAHREEILRHRPDGSFNLTLPDLRPLEVGGSTPRFY